MRTTINNKTYPMILVLLILVFGFNLQGQEAEVSGWTTSVQLDYFIPQQEIFRDIYGQNGFPLNLLVGYRLNQKLAIFTGIRYMHSSGSTQSTFNLNNTPGITSNLAMVSFPLGLNFHLSRTGVCPYIGAGGLYCIYKESWESGEFEHKDAKFGLFFNGGIQVKISRKFQVFLQAQYTSIETNTGNPIELSVNLGGFSTGFGFSYSFY